MADEQAKQFLEQAAQSMQGGQFTQALELAEQAISKEPTNADAHLLRAVALSQGNQPQAAREAFESAIEIAPHNAKIRYNFAVHLYSQGKKLEALGMAQEATRLDSTHAAAREMALRIEAESGYALESAPALSPAAASAWAQVPSKEVTVEQKLPAIHTIRLVESLGGIWLGLGWALPLLQLGYWIFAVVMFGRLPTSFDLMGEGPTGVSLGLSAFMLLYLAVDIKDRKGNWLWLLPLILCGCCSATWVALPIYLLAARKSK